MIIIKRIISITLVVAGVFMAIGSNIPVLAADSSRDDFTASPIQYNLSVDGESASLWGYVIADHVYFKLRDLAMVLNDTEKHFEVTWTADDGKKQVKLSPQLSYTPTGGELSGLPHGTKAIAHSATTHFYIDTSRIPLRAFTVNDVHYIMLSDLAANMRFAATCDEENHMTEIDTKTYDTGLYSFSFPEGWSAGGDIYFLNFNRSGDPVGSLIIRNYDPDNPVSQFQDNHRETLSSENLSGFAYPAAKALIRATQPAAANDDSYVDELHIYIMLADLRCAFDFSFDSAKVDEQTASEIVRGFVPNETAIKMNTVASQWAHAIQNRDGRAQYELLNANLQTEFYDYYEAVNWVTGVSSPWVNSYTVEISGNRAVVFYEGMTSQGFAGYTIDNLSFSEENGQLKISGIDGVNDLTGYNVQKNVVNLQSTLIGASACASHIKTGNPGPAKSDSLNEPDSSHVDFTRFAKSDTWQKNKLQWLSYIDNSYWQALYDQNYFIIAGNSQGSKINAAIGMEYELNSPGNYPPFDSVTILSLYSDIHSIKTDENNILVTIESKSAGYDAVYIPHAEMSRLPHDINTEGSEFCNFVFINSKGDILHKKRAYF